MYPKTRKEALEQRVRLYKTNKLCCVGHRSVRRTDSGACCKCLKEKAKLQRQRIKEILGSPVNPLLDKENKEKISHTLLKETKEINPSLLITSHPLFEIPAEINPTAWAEFEQHRREVKKPLTNLARKKNINILMKLTETQQTESVNQTIANRWTGLFPPKEVKQKMAGYQKPKTVGAMLSESLDIAFPDLKNLKI